MNNHKKKVGSGITEKDVPTFEGVDMMAALKQFTAERRSDEEGGIGEFEAMTRGVIALCEKILKDFEGEKREPDSPEDYAVNILRDANRVKIFLAEGRAEDAAVAAFSMGARFNEAAFKFSWETYALSGKKQAESLIEVSAKANKTRRLQRGIKWQRWQKEANRIWEAKPNLSKVAVAQNIKNKLKLDDAVETIRSRIKKPGEAG